MNARELAVVISEALDDTVRIDATPTVKKGVAFFECEDDEGHVFSVRVTKLSSDSDDERSGDADLDIDIDL